MHQESVCIYWWWFLSADFMLERPRFSKTAAGCPGSQRIAQQPQRKKHTGSSISYHSSKIPGLTLMDQVESLPDPEPISVVKEVKYWWVGLCQDAPWIQRPWQLTQIHGVPRAIQMQLKEGEKMLVNTWPRPTLPFLPKPEAGRTGLLRSTMLSHTHPSHQRHPSFPISQINKSLVQCLEHSTMPGQHPEGHAIIKTINSNWSVFIYTRTS